MNITHVVLLLDETGSMMDIKAQVIDGVNEYINSLRTQDIPYRLSLIKFDSRHHTKMHDFLPLAEVSEFKEYSPGAMTPLYDAIGRSAREIDTPKDGKVLFVIYTDGQENSSREYSLSTVKSLIEDKQKSGWTFVFLGADIDAYSTGRSLGVRDGNIVSGNRSGFGSTMSGLAGRTRVYSTTTTKRTDTFFDADSKKKMGDRKA